MAKATLVVFVIGFFLVSSGVFADEMKDREAIGEIVSGYFLSGNIDELEKLYQQYRGSEERTNSGVWKLSLFYGTIWMLRYKPSEYAQWDRLSNLFAKWKKKYPLSPAPRILSANLELVRAWRYRGGGWAYQVEEAGWEGYHKHVAIAEDILLMEKTVASSDPEWYATMLDVARSRKWNRKKFRKLADEGIRKFPGYYEIPFSAVIYYLPKWYGSPVEVEDFVNHVVNLTNKVEGMGMYARVYWVVEGEQFGPNLFRKSRIDWKKMKAGIDDVLKRYPAQWNIKAFARFACMAGDREKTRELMLRLKLDHLSNAWSRPPSFKKCRRWSMAEPLQD